MSEPAPGAGREQRAPTIDEALTNAARLLHNAEFEISNPATVNSLDDLAGRWIDIARFLHERTNP